MLETRGLGKTFAIPGRHVAAVSKVDIRLEPGSFTAIVGRSGCGKSTLLRLLASLTEPSAGSIHYAGGQKPNIGCVFQEPRLMPWLTVARNVAFGLSGKLPKAELDARIASALDLVGLTAFRDAHPDQLSGGMASRVALARALAMKPELLLLDEPFAALDAFTRRGLQQELSAIWHARRPTIVFITHDVEEAVLLADTVLHMDAGRIVDSIHVPLRHPREPTDPALIALRRRILAGLSQPVSAVSPLTNQEESIS